MPEASGADGSACANQPPRLHQQLQQNCYSSFAPREVSHIIAALAVTGQERARRMRVRSSVVEANPLILEQPSTPEEPSTRDLHQDHLRTCSQMAIALYYRCQVSGNRAGPLVFTPCQHEWRVHQRVPLSIAFISPKPPYSRLRFF